jgi:Phage derived protein Gp49-like (DUF891)
MRCRPRANGRNYRSSSIGRKPGPSPSEFGSRRYPKPIVGQSGPISDACRADGPSACRYADGLWELRPNLAGNRIARVVFFVHDGRIGVVHGFIKKTRATPDDVLELARKRMQEMQQ